MSAPPLYCARCGFVQPNRNVMRCAQKTCGSIAFYTGPRTSRTMVAPPADEVDPRPGMEARGHRGRRGRGPDA